MLSFKQDTNLTVSTWQAVGKHNGEKCPPPSKHVWSEDAEGQTGRWKISPSDVVRIRFQPRADAGVYATGSVHELLKERDRLLALKEYQQNGRRIAFLHSALWGGGTDTSYAESVVEARMLCSLLDGGGAGLPDYREALLAAGFTQRQGPNDYWDLGAITLLIEKSAFEDRPHGFIHAVFHCGMGWNNMFRLSVDYGSENNRVYEFWPTDDLRPLAVEHLLRVLRERKARQRTRLSTPLGGSPRRPY
jgi:hypothetical protein